MPMLLITLKDEADSALAVQIYFERPFVTPKE